MPKRFEDIQLGEEAQIVHTLTAHDVERFVELTGDDNRLHTDAGYAASTAFKRPVVHGMLGASFISTVIGTRLPGDGALWFAQSLEFLAPARVGDVLHVKVKVLKKHARDRFIELATEIVTDAGQKITTGVAKVRMVEPAAPASIGPEPVRGRVALVLGASGGIGRAISLQLARDGFDLALHYHSNETAARTLADEVRALGRQAVTGAADLVDAQSALALAGTLARHLPPPSVLVYCASGRLSTVRFEALEWSALALQLDVHLRGAFNVVKAFVPAMLEARYGKLVFITSQATDAPAADMAHYIAAKCALEGYARALAYDLAPRGVRVNLVSPGMTDTDLIADLPEKVRLLVASRTPLRRLARPEDVAGAVAYLASERSDFLAGETIRVNGGQTMA
jgi:3-oxoacyl-[acyl-carrier protein] reductase